MWSVSSFNMCVIYLGVLWVADNLCRAQIKNYTLSVLIARSWNDSPLHGKYRVNLGIFFYAWDANTLDPHPITIICKLFEVSLSRLSLTSHLLKFMLSSELHVLNVFLYLRFKCADFKFVSVCSVLTQFSSLWETPLRWDVWPDTSFTFRLARHGFCAYVPFSNKAGWISTLL